MQKFLSSAFFFFGFVIHNSAAYIKKKEKRRKINRECIRFNSSFCIVLNNIMTTSRGAIYSVTKINPLSSQLPVSAAQLPQFTPSREITTASS